MKVIHLRGLPCFQGPKGTPPHVLEQFIPWLVEHLPLAESFACRILRTSGLGESWVEERLQSLLKDLTDQGLDIGYCARSGEVDIRFVAMGSANAWWMRPAAAPMPIWETSFIAKASFFGIRAR